MFAVREKKKLSVFSTAGVAQRWKVTYMRDVFTGKRTTMPDDSFEVRILLFSHNILVISLVVLYFTDV